MLSVPLRVTLVCALVAPAAVSQSIVHLKFDDATGAKVVDFAGGDATATAGSLTLAPGHFGAGALSGAYFAQNGVETPIETGANGALSIGFFVKNRFANGSLPVSTMVAADGGAFSLFTGGDAGGGLVLRGWGGPDLSVHFAAEMCFMLGWNHVGIVLDGPSGAATWYLNGTAVQTTGISANPVLTAVGVVRVGAGFEASALCRYDLDEVRVEATAVSGEEMLAWAEAHPAADASFGAPSPFAIDSTGGAPALGNPAYVLEIDGPSGGQALLAVGLSRVAPGSVAGPIGATWEVLPSILAPFVFDGSGHVDLPAPIPAEPSLDEVTIYLQAFLVDERLVPTAPTSPFAIALGS